MVYKDCPNCFILTMWYVNVVSVDGLEYLNVCFILTMWYVNPPSIGHGGGLDGVLY